ncbi:MAG: hypothetical protein KF875_08040 [Trueperaceae bacterium]|nr:hypothetical protein [Trueperaceae bacterium]MCC6312081.1 hypothetical protein [Trueperaceae bacterium]MCO5173731.1 hypothetical protein [Trueperaceae bacterium]MCW5820364.1 hypothetical protein [Trueperaceae bacterium]
MALRAFPLLYASNVERVAELYLRLGFVERFRMAGQQRRNSICWFAFSD